MILTSVTPPNMCNSIRLPESVVPKAGDGDSIEIMISGTIEQDKDGNRYVAIETADGEDVPDYEDAKDMDSEDALMLFVGKLKKKKED